jgi:hypothetical protein
LTLDEQRGSRGEMLWADCSDYEDLYGIGGRGRPMKSLADRGWLSDCETGEAHPARINPRLPQMTIVSQPRRARRRPPARLSCRSIFLFVLSLDLHSEF